MVMNKSNYKKYSVFYRSVYEGDGFTYTSPWRFVGTTLAPTKAKAINNVRFRRKRGQSRDNLYADAYGISYTDWKAVDYKNKQEETK